MKLIDENVIEDAAREYAENAIPDGTGVLKNMFAEVYSEGALFAQQQLQPFIVEFAEWIDMYYQRSLNGKWRGIDVPVCDTTEQLLEEFINSKTK